MSDASSATPAAPEQLEQALFEIKKVIVGQDRAIERLLVCLLARGHCLLEGVPGLAKTLAVETLATVSGGTFTRLQFTPDLLPADIVGTRIYRASNESFDIEWGPIFANFVLADEVNRAPAKVQSALLEVMAEHHVSVGGVTRHAPEPFLVLATQNPIESEGVYPLPEAQRDRFLMKIVIGYPTPAEELEIVHRMGVNPPHASQVLTPDALIRLQAAADSVYVDHGVVDYAVNLVLATRAPASHGLPELEELISFGASPRASLGLIAAARAIALLRGRNYALPAGRVRRGPRRAAAPDRVVVRSVGPGPRCRARAGARVEHGSGTSHRPVAGPVGRRQPGSLGRADGSEPGGAHSPAGAAATVSVPHTERRGPTGGHARTAPAPAPDAVGPDGSPWSQPRS